MVVASEVARRYGERGIISISCDPGIAPSLVSPSVIALSHTVELGLLRTELQRDFNPVLRSVFVST